ncbi:MAG: CYTH and CHAD domain-containing protein [Acidobacteriota bacterium]
MGRLIDAPEAVATAAPVEIEIKMALLPKVLPRFRRHFFVRRAARSRAKLYTLYLDTPDAALLRRGVVLRLRRSKGRWQQTLKAATGGGGLLAKRPEWETPVSDKRLKLELLPPEARLLLPPDAVAKLAPCFETEVWRDTWQLNHDGALIEVALDRGEVRAGAQVCQIAEVELELKSGNLASLFDVAERLAADLPFHLETRSKAQRGYQLAGLWPCVPVKASLPQLLLDAPASTSFGQIVRSCMHQFETNLPGLLDTTDPNPEFIHQMRVALRRLRAAIGLLRFMGYAAPAWIGELKWLMGELAAARDWDVLVTETLPRVQAHLPQPDRLAGLLEAAEAQRRAANNRARAALMSSRVVPLWLKLERELALLPVSSVTTADWSRIVLRRRYRQLVRLGEQLRDLDATARHAMRIAAKKLRYSAEFFAVWHPKAARRFTRHLADVQDVLGVLNDAAVTARLLAELAMAGDAARYEAIGLVTGFLACEQVHYLAKLEQLWHEFHDIPPYWKKGRLSRPLEPANAPPGN